MPKKPAVHILKPFLVLEMTKTLSKGAVRFA